MILQNQCEEKGSESQNLRLSRIYANHECADILLAVEHLVVVELIFQPSNYTT